MNHPTFWLSALLMLCFTLSFFPASGQDDYEKAWERVEADMDERRTRSALEKVQAIGQQARAENNQPQLIKAITHEINLNRLIEEKGDSLAVARLRQEIEGFPQPGQAVLRSILAEMLLAYYNLDRWRINDRSYTEVRPEDLSTWDARTYFEAIKEQHLAALEPRATLIGTPVRSFAAILDTAEESPTYRPSLYDLLAFRALDFFRNGATDLPRPGDTYQIPPEIGFLPTQAFLAQTQDLGPPYPEDRDYQALRIFRDLIAYQVEQGLTAPLIDAELKRLSFMQDRLNPGGETYRAALQALAEAHADHHASTLALHAWAEAWVSAASDFNPIQPAEPARSAYREAYDLCQRALDHFPESLGADRCRALLNRIEKKDLQVQVETVNLPDQPFRALVEHRNLNQAFLRMVRIDEDLRQAIERARDQRGSFSDKLINILRDEPAVTQKTLTFLATDDFHRHRLEIALEPLPVGDYYLLISDGENFDPKTSSFATAEMQVSGLTLLTQQLPGDRLHFALRERRSGAPAGQVKAEVYRSTEYQLPKNPSETHFTDPDGSLTLPIREGDRIVEVHFSRGDDQLKSERIYVGGDPYGDRMPSNRVRVHLFTDRAIYRPSQTIYFKGIATLQTDRGAFKASEGREVKVQLRDVNGQVVAEQTFTTNAYGSFHGSFTAPMGGLTGNMTLRTDLGSRSIRVEEYKRPTFEVKLDSLSSDYALSDTVSLSGEALSYSGVKLSGVTVRYRVVRQARFPYWYFWWRPAPSSPEQEIASGEVQTDEQGKFVVEFPARPDPDLDPDSKPVFTYAISVDVIDLSGETHSASKDLRLGYVGLEMALRVDDLVNRAQPGELSLSTRNLDGSFVPTEGTLRVYRLDAPEVPLRPRFWPQPDQYELASPEAYRATFPHDVYQAQDQPDTWARLGRPVIELPLNTGESKQLDLGFLREEPAGAYLAEFITAQDSLRSTARFRLFDAEQPTPPVPDWLEVKMDQNRAEPGEQVNLLLMTSEPTLYVRYELWHDNQRLDSAWLEIRDGALERTINVEESHRGGLTVHLAYFRENHRETLNRQIDVPWTNKQLNLSWETFRSPLLPGQKEEWRLTIRGSEAEAVAAELVATMYDASLESFVGHDWSLDLYPHFSSRLRQNIRGYGSTRSNLLSGWSNAYDLPRGPGRQSYDGIQWDNYGAPYSPKYVGFTGTGEAEILAASPSPRAEMAVSSLAMDITMTDMSMSMEDSSLEPYEWDLGDGLGEKAETPPPAIVPRTNLSETAFFFPDLRTNAQGEVVLSFTMPEALTRWRFIGLAHTPDFKVGKIEGETVTQKELMVTPNLPRFFRQGDQMQLSAKLSNLSDSALQGNAYLEMVDARTLQPLDRDFDNVKNGRPFQVDVDGSVAVQWAIEVPETAQAVAVRITARAGNFADGEEKILPILSNRMLVTESRPFIVRGNDKERFTWEKLAKADDSESLRHHQVTLEITENPVWYALQALPYLMEYPYECTEQIFSRYYANTLASHVARSQPQFQRVFAQWRDLPDSEALLSQLDKNEELKSALLSETPWVMDAMSDTERKRRLGLLFDLNHMAQQQQTAYQQLLRRQNRDGSFSWYPGMPGSRYVTQLIVNGLGHLEQLGVASFSSDPEMGQALSQALRYLDQQVKEDYRDLQDQKADLEKDHLGYSQIQYLYGRSFFPRIELSGDAKPAYDYYAGQAERYWTEQSFYMQGMLALVFSRGEKTELSQKVLATLLENTIRTDNRGYYWKGASGWFWYQAPIERQALLIEAFHEIGGYEKEVEEMNLWLLQQKRTQDWGSTRATVEACHALLLTQGEWMQQRAPLQVQVGGERIDAAQDATNGVEAGTGYYQVRWDQRAVTPRLAEVRLDNPNPGPAWGALYWQYFEDLDQITPAETPLSLRKQIYKVTLTPDGEKLVALSDGAQLQPGDRLRIRVEIRVDRAMSYVHFKDMRAAGLEPVEALSGYQYQGGLGYYRSIRDASMNYFFETLPQGTWTLEYDLRANLSGSYSNGIATLQCFYAPEYSSHSAGERVEVE